MHPHTGAVVALIAGSSIEAFDREAIAWALSENRDAHKVARQWLAGARQAWASASPRTRERIRADLSELMAREALAEFGELVEQAVA